MATRDTSGSGRAGAGVGPDIGEAFGAATRDYFEAMTRALRGAAGSAPAPVDPWRAVFDAWSAAAGGQGGFGTGGPRHSPFGAHPFGPAAFAQAGLGQGGFGPGGFGQGGFGQGGFGPGAFGQPAFAGSSFGDSLDAVVGRFAEQGRQWFGRMQALVERFAGGEAAPADIAQAWKSMLGGDAANPFTDLFAQMGGRGHAGFDQWLGQVAPLLRAGWADAWMREGAEWLSLPAFGPAREHQERGQALARAMLGLQQANDAYNALMLEAGRDAFVRFERKLGERSEPGRQLKSARALFDLWVDAAEEAYAEVALSVEFRQRYAALVDAQMRVRAGVQDVVERMTAQFGMPTRTEVDAAHRRIAQLERELRRLQRGGAATAAAAASPAAKRRTAATSAASAAAAKPETTGTETTRTDTTHMPAAEKSASPMSSGTPASSGKRAAPRSRAAKAKSPPQGRAKRDASGKPAPKPGASAAKPGKAAGAKRKTVAEARARPAAARAKPAASRRTTLSITSAIPQAPEPLPARAAALEPAALEPAALALGALAGDASRRPDACAALPASSKAARTR